MYSLTHDNTAIELLAVIPETVCIRCYCSELIESLLDTMHQSGADFTNTFRGLSRLRMSGNVSESVADVKNYLLEQCATLEELQSFHAPRMDPR